MPDLKPCKCGGIPEIRETYDTLRICCPKCGKATPVMFGDYYDEGFMTATYMKIQVAEWSKIAGEDSANG